MRQNNWIDRAIAEPIVQVRGSHDCFEKRTEGGALSFRAHRASEATHRFNYECPPRSVFGEARESNRSSAFREIPRRGFTLTIACTLLAHLRKCLIRNGAGEWTAIREANNKQLGTAIAGVGNAHPTLVIITKSEQAKIPVITPENRAKHRYLTPLLVKKNNSRPRSTFGNHSGRLRSDQDLMTIPEADILKTRNRYTIIGGNIVFQAK